jgi:CO/xanthine dehydrogenase FAD-binding subunit
MTTANLVYMRKLPKFDYLAPKTVDEACTLLTKYKGKAKVIAGGTDLIVAMKKRTVSPQYIINIKSVSNLDYIRYSDSEGLRIGAMTTLHELETSSVVKKRCPMLAAATHEMAQPQIRNVATIGGNLCNAAPSADTAPPLIGLGAKVKMKSINAERTVALEEFFSGPGTTILRTDEILTEIQVPNPPPYTRAVYIKLPARTAIDIAAVGVAAVVTLDSKQTAIVDAKIVLGAVAPTPIRARKAEDIIRGKAINEQLIDKASQSAADEARPISDVRSSANYRKEMVKVLTKQAIRQVIAST